MKREMLDTVDAALSRFENEPELIELAPGETSLNLLQRIYRSVKQPMSRRMRAAIEALPHEHPRLGAVAIGSMNGHDFASLLERAIERSGKRREVKQIEGRAVDLTPRPGRPMEDFEARLRQLEK
jgi:hypothetical protein